MKTLRLFVLSVVLIWTACGTTSNAPQIERLSPQAFASVIKTLSEPTGFFDSDNYISNESSYLYVVPKLKQLDVQGGVYIGVGPDQNFTYIAKIRPKYAFIVDIRRDNLIEHLLFKALFEMSDTRQAFLSNLFSKPLVNGTLPPGPPLLDLVRYFDETEGREDLYRSNLDRIIRIVAGYEMSLSAGDMETIEKTYHVFYTHHLNLQWEYRTEGSRGIFFPPYRDFLLGQDMEGRYGNFLNSDEEFLFIKDMQARNMIIPVTGNFAGNQALAAIAEYISKRGDTVSAFYLSNVEYYLVPDGLMSAFAANVARLPITDRSVLIRAFVNLRSGVHPARVGNHLMTTVLQPIQSFNRLFAEGRYKTYWDVGTADYIP